MPGGFCIMRATVPARQRERQFIVLAPGYERNAFASKSSSRRPRYYDDDDDDDDDASIEFHDHNSGPPPLLIPSHGME